MDTSTKKQVINLTDSAHEQLKSLFEKDKNSPDGVRISLTSGGCSGLAYQMDFDKKKDNDVIAEYDSLKVLVDPKSALYIYGLIIDYDGGLNGKGFTYENPNAQEACGCGTSFSVGKDVNIDYANMKKAQKVCSPESTNKQ